MAVTGAHPDEHLAAGEGPLHEQYENIDQQNESYIVGMWTFLVTEVMFFGALFVTYVLYRWRYQSDFYIAHLETNTFLGGLNTTVLLCSSFTMALAVRSAMLKNRTGVIAGLIPTLMGAVTFLVVKYFEYMEKFAKHHYPGPSFIPPPGSTKGGSEIFFSLYFGMTGLHGIHIVIGIIAIGTLIYLWAKKRPIVTEDYVPTEMVGLYWHFVDLVWVFLFPLYYLIPK
ncbi:MAG: cytochrome c oxidase subunit 3 [Fimbriimonadaceae bacterium]